MIWYLKPGFTLIWREGELIREIIVVVDDDGGDDDGDDDGDDGDDDGGGNALLVLPVVQLESLAACCVLEVKW